MAPEPPRNKTKRNLLTGITALAVAGVLAATLLPMALADPTTAAQKSGRAFPAEADRDRPFMKRFSLNMSGTGVDRGNNTYTLDIAGIGHGRLRHNDDGNITALLGRAQLRVVIKDANGSVVLDRELTVYVKAHKADDGRLKWQMIAFSDRGLPHFGLRGNATREARGLFDLDGQGRIGFKQKDAQAATVLKVDVTGQIAKV